MIPHLCWARGGIAAAGVALLTACTPPAPTAPTVLVLPAPGESFTVFQQHETICRQYASAETDGQTPSQAAAKSSLGGAMAGAGLGAATGALLGSVSAHAGSGAAIGAGAGLLMGSVMGAGQGQKAAALTQDQYNMSYSQCMIANGDRVAAPASPMIYAAPPVVYAAPPAAVYVVAPPPAVLVPAW